MKEDMNTMNRKEFLQTLSIAGIFATTKSEANVPLYYEIDRPVFNIEIKGLKFKQFQYCAVWTTIYKHSLKKYVEEHSKLHHVVIYKWDEEGGITQNGTYDGYLVIRSVLLPKNQPYEYVFDSDVFKPVYKI